MRWENLRLKNDDYIYGSVKKKKSTSNDITMQVWNWYLTEKS